MHGLNVLFMVHFFFYTKLEKERGVFFVSFNPYKKINFCEINVPDEKFMWSYSRQELLKMLNEKCKGLVLKKIYVNLLSFLESLRYDRYYCDLSYLGGTVILVFNKLVVQMEIHGIGMIEYRIINPWEIKIKKIYDLPPTEGLYGDKFFYDLSLCLDSSFIDQKIEYVAVDRTDYYSIYFSSFDDEKAEKAGKERDLPRNIHFHLENGLDLVLYGDELEYFYIKLEK